MPSIKELFDELAPLTALQAELESRLEQNALARSRVVAKIAEVGGKKTTYVIDGKLMVVRCRKHFVEAPDGKKVPTGAETFYLLTVGDAPQTV
jgi:hypothetical protein